MTKEEALKLVKTLANASVRRYQMANLQVPVPARVFKQEAKLEKTAARAILLAIVGYDEEAAISDKELNDTLEN